MKSGPILGDSLRTSVHYVLHNMWGDSNCEQLTRIDRRRLCTHVCSLCSRLLASSSADYLTTQIRTLPDFSNEQMPTITVNEWDPIWGVWKCGTEPPGPNEQLAPN